MDNSTTSTDLMYNGSLVGKDNTNSDHTVVTKPECLYGPQVIDVIMRKPEFSFLIRYYNLLYQSLIPNCKLTVKTLKQHLEIPSDVESFVVNGESSRIRCQRIINLLLVHLDATRDYKHFCYLFSMISVMTDLPDKLRTDPNHPPHPSRLITTSNVNQLDNYAVDNIIIRCVDDGPSDDRADNYSISSHHHVIGRRRCRPVTNKVDFTPLKTHYHTILQLMPDSYEQSVGKLQNYISDDKICMILSSSNSTTANKIILDCLIERMICREELLDLCDQLEAIATSHQLIVVISEIRADVQQSIQFPIRATSTTNIQSLSCDQQHRSTSPSSNLYQKTFSELRLDPCSKVLPVLKKYYTRLCHCLPQDYVKTVDKLKQLIPGIPADYLDQLRTLPSTELINETIISVVMCGIIVDGNVFAFCDILEMLCDKISSKNVIESLRNEFLEALCSLPPSKPTTTNISPLNNGISSSSGSHHPTTLHQTSNDSSVGVGSTPVVSNPIQPTQGYVNSNVELQEQLSYKHKHLEKGIKCPPPPPLPPNYVCRQQLLDELVSKLCQSTIDPNSYGTSLTVTGDGGFGKTSIVTALCHHPVIKEQFTDGVVFIELGPQATDPSMKLKGLYNLLTDKQCDVNVVEWQIHELTSLYCRNLLVIIDDVWHIEDAEPIVKAFSNCKIVLTTRINDVEQYIPTKQVVSVGSMEQSEAISLLTCRVVDISQLSQEDVILLDELAQDVHLWPLLLSLIRGQLFHNMKQHKLCFHEAIQVVQANLLDKGLTAFDKNNVDKNNVEISRKYAVKVCIEVTLELLTKSLSDKLKSLILWNGIGASLQTAVLRKLWNITENKARDIVDVLWAYGLVHFTDTIMPPHNTTQCCVEVHAVISQYIIECINISEIMALSPWSGLGTSESVHVGLIEQFQKSFGIDDISKLCSFDYLQYTLYEITHNLIPFYLKQIHNSAILDPHHVVLILQEIQIALTTTTPSIATFLSTFNQEIDSLVSDCHKILKGTHKWSRTLNQKIQRCLTQRDYHRLIQTIETFASTYPISMTAQQAVVVVKKIIPYCDGKTQDHIMKFLEHMQMMTTDYHLINLLLLPRIKLRIKHLQQIDVSLQAGSPHIETTQHFFLSGQHREELELVSINHLIMLQEVAPNYVHQHASKRGI